MSQMRATRAFAARAADQPCRRMTDTKEQAPLKTLFSPIARRLSTQQVRSAAACDRHRDHG
jgi:hypothetical protein